jgi:hypothetical protein
MGRYRRILAAAAVVATLANCSGPSFFDSDAATQVQAVGTETLGPPNIPIAEGSGVVAGGTGMVTQPGNITLDVPAVASVEQVLLYWNGFHSQENAGADDAISVNGVGVTGTLIGGPTLFFAGHYSSTFRADITALGLVAAGPNSLTISDMAFDRVNNGAGIIVIFDDGSNAEIDLVDGQDLAFINFAPPLNATVAQTFTFAPEPVDRTANLSMFLSSVEGQDLPGQRPTVVRITVGGVVTELDNLLMSGDGEEWDTMSVAIDVPAGIGAVTVQAFSEDNLGTGNLPASLAWIAATLSLPTTTPPDMGGEGCTPGYWRNHVGSWVGFAPGDDYGTVFGVAPTVGSINLLDAVRLGGGGERALIRHSVAALLNAANPNVSYEFSVAEVIAIVQNAYFTGNFESAKNLLEAENEAGCPLN